MADRLYNIFMENIASQPSPSPQTRLDQDSKTGLYKLIDLYKASDDSGKAEFKQALRRILTDPPKNPEALTDAVLVASALKIWDLENEVRELALSAETTYVQGVAKAYLTGVELSRAPASVRASSLQTPTPLLS